jgi:hypothetical protein
VSALRATELWATAGQTDRASLCLTSPEVLREAQCLDEAIIAVEQAYIALLKAGMAGMTACGHLRIAPQFKILARKVCVPGRTNAASVGWFYAPLLKIMELYVKDRDACMRVFDQPLNNN